jgi:hypothetical protein
LGKNISTVDEEEKPHYSPKTYETGNHRISQTGKRIERPLDKTREPESITLFFFYERALIDSYSSGKLLDTAAINPAVIEYLESGVRNIPLKKQLTIEIEYGGKIPEDPFLPEKLIKKNLEASIGALFKRNFRITINSLILALAGIVILGLINRIPYFNSRYAFNELFVVISWVFIWRFVELFFFERARLRLRRMKLLQIFLARYKMKEAVS